MAAASVAAPAPAPAAPPGPALQFGFVPTGTVAALCDLGNWKVRADAIETLLRLVLDLPHSGAVLPTLPEFVGFLNKLLADPNFKISLTTLQIWDALLGKVGRDALSVVPAVVPTLIRKLGDSKMVVRQANIRVLNTLYHVLPGATLSALLSAIDGRGAGTGTGSSSGAGAAQPPSARIKEDILNVVIRSMLDERAFPAKDIDTRALISTLVTAAQARATGGGAGEGGEAAADDARRARTTAVEALAVAVHRLGREEGWRLINGTDGAGCGPDLRWELTARFEDSRLASVSSQGLVQHAGGANAVLMQPRVEVVDGVSPSLRSSFSPSREGGVGERDKASAGEEWEPERGVNGELELHAPPQASSTPTRREKLNGLRQSSFNRKSMNDDSKMLSSEAGRVTGEAGEGGGMPPISQGGSGDGMVGGGSSAAGRGVRHSPISSPHHTARRRESLARRQCPSEEVSSDDEHGAPTASGSAARADVSHGGIANLLKRRTNRTALSLQVGGSAEGERGLRGSTDGSGGGGGGAMPYVADGSVGHRSDRWGHDDVDWGGGGEGTGGNGGGNYSGGGGGGGSAPNPRSGSMLGRRAAAANAQRQARADDSLAPADSSMPTSPSSSWSSAPVWLSNDPPPLDIHSSGGGGGGGRGRARGGKSATPASHPVPFAAISRMAHSPPTEAGHHLKLHSNSTHNSSEKDTEICETYTPTSPLPIFGAESPTRRSDIGGKLTALKRRQESRRAHTANLPTTPHAGSRTNTAPGDGGSTSEVGYVVESGTPLGHSYHSYLTGRTNGGNVDGRASRDDAMHVAMDFRLAEGHGSAASRPGHAVAGRRAGVVGGIGGAVEGITREGIGEGGAAGSLAQRRNLPGGAHVVSASEVDGGGSGRDSNLGARDVNSAGGGAGVHLARGSGPRSGFFAPGGVSTPSAFARPHRDAGDCAAPGGGHGHDRVRPGATSRAGPRSDSPSVTGLPRTGAVSSRGGSRGLQESNANPLGELTTEELQPVSNPEGTLRKAVADLVAASVAKPKELDWQAQHQGLVAIRRLAVHHGAVLLPQLHTTILAMIPAIDSLRSSIAKMAMALVKEMSQFLDQKSLDNELDYLVPVLAKKSGENNWLGGEADGAIREFVLSATDVRVLSSLIAPARHKSPAVRMRVVCHIESCCANATAKTFAGSAGNRDLLEKTFSSVVALLEDGNVDTRTMAKRSLCHLHRHLTATQASGERCGDFERLLKRLPNEAKIKVVRMVVEKGPPPLPEPKSGSFKSGAGTPRSLATSTPTLQGGSSGAVTDRGPGGAGIRGHTDGLLLHLGFGPNGIEGNGGGGGGLHGRRTMSLPSDGSIVAAVAADEEALAAGGRENSLGLLHSHGAATDHGVQGSGSAASVLGSHERERSAGEGSSTSRGSSGGSLAGFKQRMAAGRGSARGGGSGGGTGKGGGGGHLQEVMAPVFLMLQSSDWKERSDGIAQLQSLAEAAAPGSFTEAAVMATFDALVPRLGDGNSKVSVQALNTLSAMLPSLGDDVAPVLSTLVPALAGGIGSTNDKVRLAAVDASDRLLESVSAPLLVPHMSHCVSHGVLRAKPVLLHKLVGLTEAVHPTRPQLVTKHILPAALTTLMNESRGEVRAANLKLLTALSNCLGRDELLGHAGAVSAAAAGKVEDTLFSFSS